MSIGRRIGHASAASAFALAVAVAAIPAGAQSCVGDCDANDAVDIRELLLGVNIAQDRQSVDVCPSFDCRRSGSVRIACLIQAVDNALQGCDLTKVTATVPPATATATVAPPTPTGPPVCPLMPGRYTITQLGGGTLRVATFAPFEFPAGGTLIVEIGPGNSDCVHDAVVPFPGGFDIPVFCIQALGATTTVTQTGCGIGRIDSDGGSDFTIREDGDTSETTLCNAAQAVCALTGPAPDSSGRLDVTVGDGRADNCVGGNAIVTVPVRTLTWVAADGSCPDADGAFNADTDTVLVEFPQTLDLTTDTTSARFTDLDGDGCAKSGLGPTAPFSSTGVCIDWERMTVSTADSGVVFSSGGPTFDVLFTNTAPNTIRGPTPSEHATCASPPEINFAGLQSRCLNGE